MAKRILSSREKQLLRDVADALTDLQLDATARAVKALLVRLSPEEYPRVPFSVALKRMRMPKRTKEGLPSAGRIILASMTQEKPMRITFVR